MKVVKYNIDIILLDLRENHARNPSISVYATVNVQKQNIMFWAN